jgi:uncharacterized oxidoreductase
MKLEGKKVLITGGGSGIGLELARRLAGTNEVVIAGRSVDRLRAAQADEPRLRPMQLDVTSETSAAQVIDQLRAEFGGLDMLVNSAGVLHGGDLMAAHSAITGAEELAVNLEGAIRKSRLALPLLEASAEAGIVFMSSAVALTAVPHLSVYAASKAGVHSFARSLRAELAPTKVHVIEVLPPVVDTDLASGLEGAKIPPASVVDALLTGIRRGKQQIPVGRVRALVPLTRLAPRTADGIVQRALQLPDETSSRHEAMAEAG